VSETLLTAIRHSCWANVELIAFCAKLTPEQLAWTGPGTFGSIHATLQHIVGAEQGYLFRLTGEEPPQGMFKPDVLVGLDELAERERSVRERAETLLAGRFDEDAWHKGRAVRAKARIVVAQLIHHGSITARTSGRSSARAASSRRTSTCGPTGRRPARWLRSRSPRRRSAGRVQGRPSERRTA